MLSGPAFAAVAVAALSPPIAKLTDVLLLLHFHVAVARASHGFHVRSYILAPVFASLAYLRPKGTDIILPSAFFAVDAAYCIWLAAEHKPFGTETFVALAISTGALIYEAAQFSKPTKNNGGNPKN